MAKSNQLGAVALFILCAAPLHASRVNSVVTTVAKTKTKVPFECPSACQECCHEPNLLFGTSTSFKCILKGDGATSYQESMRAAALGGGSKGSQEARKDQMQTYNDRRAEEKVKVEEEGYKCGTVSFRQESMGQFKVSCEYKADTEKAPLQCSAQTLCCCKEDKGVCFGDQSTGESLAHAYGDASEYGLESWGGVAAEARGTPGDAHGGGVFCMEDDSFYHKNRKNQQCPGGWDRHCTCDNGCGGVKYHEGGCKR